METSGSDLLGSGKSFWLRGPPVQSTTKIIQTTQQNWDQSNDELPKKKRGRNKFFFQVTPHTSEHAQFSREKDLNTKVYIKNVLRKQKVKKLTQNFRVKLKRNNTHFTPIDSNIVALPQEETQKADLTGIMMHQNMEILFYCITIAHFILSYFVFGMGLVYAKQVQSFQQFDLFEIFSIIMMLAQLFYGAACQKIVGDRRLLQISEIFNHYRRNQFAIDMICLSVLAIDLGSDWEGMKFFRLLFFLKFRDFFRKVSELENVFINNFQRQQYWGVVKVFLINFLLAHLLGVVLICISTGEENWMATMGIGQNPWNEQYCYAYFWAMSTMLGFGNANPSNYKEAILISVIQCVSCIILAYIINEVGTLLTNIAKKNQAKEKNLQTSRRLALENQISEDLLSKINNYIRQTDSIEKKFNFQSDRQFIGSLPADLKGQFLKESNKRIFRGLAFFKTLTQKTLMDLAERINIKIAHPQQVVFNRRENFKFLILKKGKVGFYAQSIGRKLRDIPIDIVHADGTNANLLSLCIFHREYPQDRFSIRALDFSVIYQLCLDETLQTLKDNSYDYEKFCQLKDESKHIIDQFETIICEHCETNHSKMKCPRFHYMPLKSLTIFKYINSLKTCKNFHSKIPRLQKKFNSKPLLMTADVFQKMENILISAHRRKFNKHMSFQTKDSVADDNPPNMKVASMKQVQDARNDATELLNQVQGIWKPPVQHQHSAMKKVVFDIKDIIEDVIKINRYHDDQIFWDLEIDELHNFKYYFTNKNPHCLKDFSLKFNLIALNKMSAHGRKVEMRRVHRTKGKFQTLEDDTILREDSSILEDISYNIQSQLQ